MVKLGFIVEGDSEQIILKSENFSKWADELGFAIVGIFISGGEGNFKIESDKIKQFVKIFRDRKADYIILWTDNENDPCKTYTLNSIYQFDENQIVLLSVKTLESWYLADSITLSGIFRRNLESEPTEAISQIPIEVIRGLFVQHLGQGFGKSKIRLAKRMVNEGFTIQNAAEHPRCESAKYFINKLKTLAKEKE